MPMAACRRGSGERGEGEMEKPTLGDKLFGLILWLVGLAGILYGVGLLGYQCLLWLKAGYWTAYEINSLWGGTPIHSKWAGVAQITTWLFSQSLAVGSFLVGCLLAFVGDNIGEGK